MFLGSLREGGQISNFLPSPLASQSLSASQTRVQSFLRHGRLDEVFFDSKVCAFALGLSSSQPSRFES
eukprot:m.631536 g.631536  ORF g.631536 m.631536 type:complete len:68 (+) comp58284_c0_seq26:1202-1405(+)